MKLWIDDLREPPEGWDWAKTSREAIALLGDCEYETISFDHDLGGEDTGIKVLNWMAWDCPDLKWPKKIMIHSYNPVGAQNLYNVATRYAPAGTLIQRVSFA